MKLDFGRTTIGTRFYPVSHSGQPEMQFDVSNTTNNLSVEDAKVLRARLDEFIKAYDTVTLTVLVPRHREKDFKSSIQSLGGRVENADW